MMIRLYHCFLALMLFLITVAQISILTLPPTSEQIYFEINRVEYGFPDDTEISVKVKYGIRSVNPISVQVFVLPLVQDPIDKKVYIYYDKDYPSSVPRNDWVGLLDHIPIELRLRSYSGEVEIVDASKLAEVMLHDRSSIVIMPSGVFPDTVYSRTYNLVKPWLQQGGIIVWIGDAFGALYGLKDGTVACLYPQKNFAIEEMFGYPLLQDAGEIVNTDSLYSTALDLRYSNTHSGAVVAELAKNGGEVLGRIGELEIIRTSIAFAPLGEGGVILFGGGVSGVHEPVGVHIAARDVALILLSGFLHSGYGLEYNEHLLQKNEQIGDQIEAVYDTEQIIGINIVAFSKVVYNYFYSRTFFLFSTANP